MEADFLLTQLLLWTQQIIQLLSKLISSERTAFSMFKTFQENCPSFQRLVCYQFMDSIFFSETSLLRWISQKILWTSTSQGIPIIMAQFLWEISQQMDPLRNKAKFFLQFSSSIFFFIQHQFQAWVGKKSLWIIWIRSEKLRTTKLV